MDDPTTTSDDFWRRRPSDEGMPPRITPGVFTPPGTLDSSIKFYEDIQGLEADGGFAFPAARLRLAVVGAFLIIEGDEEALAPFRSP
ncbi:hypothetical protein GCM10011579_033270 [Streptomyces albiflavescens]|uniref:Glyoxalase n=1 Tax=Streptomyces albiflavescens TaxID=1623582 RepID=A0A917Y311_9ACTN|nr:hypothetical protein [Streptomyces albiflavescens]GGN64148.1 hypothetical protein GCM10011579_033270 [Streptomyces albiflavescens]